MYKYSSPFEWDDSKRTKISNHWYKFKSLVSPIVRYYSLVHRKLPVDQRLIKGYLQTTGNSTDLSYPTYCAAENIREQTESHETTLEEETNNLKIIQKKQILLNRWKNKISNTK